MNRSYTVLNGTEVIETGEHDVEWSDVKTEREMWFKITDLWYLKDRWDALSSSKKGKLNSFRQALRDLPQNYESPNDAADNFPEPEEWF